MSATIEPFPGNPRAAPTRLDASLRYVQRAQEAFELLTQARSNRERSALCEIAEIWLDMAESALPAHA